METKKKEKTTDKSAIQDSLDTFKDWLKLRLTPKEWETVLLKPSRRWTNVNVSAVVRNSVSSYWLEEQSWLATLVTELVFVEDWTQFYDLPCDTEMKYMVSSVGPKIINCIGHCCGTSIWSCLYLSLILAWLFPLEMIRINTEIMCNGIG